MKLKRNNNLVLHTEIVEDVEDTDYSKSNMLTHFDHAKSWQAKLSVTFIKTYIEVILINLLTKINWSS
jgi:hypothetical protein